MSKPSVFRRILPPLALLPVLLLAACALPQRIDPNGQPLASGTTPGSTDSAAEVSADATPPAAGQGLVTGEDNAPPPVTETPLTDDGQARGTSDLASAGPTATTAAVSPEPAPASAASTPTVPPPAASAASVAAPAPAAVAEPSAAETATDAGAATAAVTPPAPAAASPAPAASSAAAAATSAAPASAETFALPNLPALPPQGGAPVATAPPAQVVAEAQPPASTSGQSAAHTLARESLERARNRLNLSAEDRQRIQAIDQELGADPAAAYLAASKLDQQLAAASRTYQVQGNETLSQIAEQSDVYGNAYLWPLLVQANPKKLKNPQAVYNGLQLKVPLHPTAGEVAAALEQTHRLTTTPAAAAKPPAASGDQPLSR